MQTGKPKVIVAHPQLGIANACRDLLPEYEVVTVTSLEQLLDIADDTFVGMIVACCFPGYTGDGITFAKQYAGGKLDGFRGVVTGICCSITHFDDFDASGIEVSDRFARSCQVLSTLLREQVSA